MHHASNFVSTADSDDEDYVSLNEKDMETGIQEVATGLESLKKENDDISNNLIEKEKGQEEEEEEEEEASRTFWWQQKKRKSKRERSKQISQCICYSANTNTIKWWIIQSFWHG